jgi:hypothetical protein
VYFDMELTLFEDLKATPSNSDSLNGASVLDIREASLGSEHLVTRSSPSFHKLTRLYVTLLIPRLAPPSSEVVLHDAEFAITIYPFVNKVT